jgi:threonine dehydratase
MRGFGAELVVHGHDYQSAREHATVLGAERGLEIVPSYHRDLVLGVATYARELLGGAGELDAVYVPVSMGSGISGIIGVRDLLGLRTEVVGVVAERAPATARSVRPGLVVVTDTANTFIDGVACRVPDADAIAVMCAGAARVITVGEDDAAEAMRVLFTATHNPAEPAARWRWPRCSRRSRGGGGPE